MGDKRQVRADIIESLHSSRLQPYLQAAAQDQKRALELYRWNLQLTSAFQELLSVTEVVLASRQVGHP